jgi:hypothetical protein
MLALAVLLTVLLAVLVLLLKYTTYELQMAYFSCAVLLSKK